MVAAEGLTVVDTVAEELFSMFGSGSLAVTLAMLEIIGTAAAVVAMVYVKVPDTLAARLGLVHATVPPLPIRGVVHAHSGGAVID